MCDKLINATYTPANPSTLTVPASGAGRSPAGEACPVVSGAELACLGMGVASAKYDCSASAASSGAYWSQAEVGEQLARMMDFHRYAARVCR